MRQTQRPCTELCTPLINLTSICVEGMSPGTSPATEADFTLMAHRLPVSLCRVTRSPLWASGSSFSIHRVPAWVRSYRETLPQAPSEGVLGCCMAIILRSPLAAQSLGTTERVRGQSEASEGP